LHQTQPRLPHPAEAVLQALPRQHLLLTPRPVSIPFLSDITSANLPSILGYQELSDFSYKLPNFLNQYPKHELRDQHLESARVGPARFRGNDDPQLSSSTYLRFYQMSNYTKRRGSV
jgi:hypothetical protein